jgi:hypothetical protein
MIEFIKATDIVGNEEDWVQIDRGNGEYTSMRKSTYDAMQAEQSTQPIGGNI